MASINFYIISYIYVHIIIISVSTYAIFEMGCGLHTLDRGRSKEMRKKLKVWSICETIEPCREVGEIT
jgi:hypothetical protein